MFVPRIDTRPAPAGARTGAGPSLPLSVEGQVQNALNLYLPMKSPAQMPALLETLAGAQVAVNQALSSLHYVHFARFLPNPDGSMLWVITEFDGALESYLMDFVAVLGDAFNAILQFVAGAPPLPVQRYAREFTQFVTAHNLNKVHAWSAYPDVTVIDILRNARSL
jgi:hypothetical protein